ncbi:MAG: ATP-grasp domain-containing protein [Coprobacillus cateniformis]|uniref:ATP-grasp domain-containing protein n=1 Tax=Longibaculum muris TaxID=1796628 RepID=UPI003AB81F8F|nr:ATP-grasp domain-containing protein [Coprobacillus cateniformis]
MNILFTSVGRRTYLVNYFREALNGEGKIFVANSDVNSPAFLAADECVVSPLIYDDNYISFLLEYCNKNKINAIISLFDIDLPILSKNKKLFEDNGINVIVSDENVLNICNDKYSTYKFLKENGFNTPKTYLDVEEAKKILKYPVILKPRWGMGSIGIYKADNNEELEVFYKKLSREIFNTYLKYESSVDIEQSILIQEMIIGQEYGLDIINDLHGNYQNTIVKKKIAMRSGETDCAQTVDNVELKNIGMDISHKIKHIANLDCDAFIDENGNVYILEMNARFGGGYPFSHLAGVNLPKAIVKWLKNEEVLINQLLSAEINIKGQKDIQIVKL